MDREKTMKCPFKKELELGTMVCDAGYDKCHSRQCPTEIFNSCQEEANNEALKMIKQQ